MLPATAPPHPPPHPPPQDCVAAASVAADERIQEEIGVGALMQREWMPALILLDRTFGRTASPQLEQN